MPILFYSPNDHYGCFSNFSRHQVTVYGRTWKTSEHAFQGAKFFPHTEYVDLTANAPTPGQAANLHGRNRSYPLRPDWDNTPGPEYDELVKRLTALPQPDDEIDRRGGRAEPLFVRTKDVVMYEVCYAKFTQHEDLRKILVGTAPHALIEDTSGSGDPYWGWGTSRVLENKLGRILMLIRGELVG